jgi:glycerol-3-phosphate dehydrogenase
MDFKRVRESSRERSILLKTAPHLATPMPILMPTYGHGMRGKEILRSGLFIYELITFDRNKDIDDSERQIPRSMFLTKDEVLKEYPGIEGKNLTGGVVFYDGQIYSPPRLVLSFIRSSVDEGLYAANYLEAIDYIIEGNRVKGVVALDRLTGERMEIRGKFVLNAAGPWAHRLNDRVLGKPSTKTPSFSRDLVMVVPKQLSPNYAFAYLAKTKDKDALFDRGGRHLFIVPWRNYSLIGVWHQAFNKAPEEITIGRAELQRFLDEINHVYQGVELTLGDVSFINTGLILFGAENDQGRKANHSFGKRSMLIDHLKEQNLEGLLTLIGVRATVARKDAQETIDFILRRLNKKASGSKTDTTPIYGGRIDNFNEYCRRAKDYSQEKLGFKVSRSMLHNYGSEYQSVLKYIHDDASLGQEIDTAGVINAEVVHAVREEMAVKLQDVVFRRTEIGTGENPGRRAIEVSADLMAAELGWNQQKTEDEINEVLDIFSRRGPWKIA